jgi:AraC-like DNA-binding protein
MACIRSNYNFLLAREVKCFPIKALTVKEVSEMTGLSPQTVTRLFEKEPGVIILSRPEKMHKRRYRSLRVPRHVDERVIARITI